jgi:hypothetical protein
MPVAYYGGTELLEHEGSTVHGANAVPSNNNVSLVDGYLHPLCNVKKKLVI